MRRAAHDQELARASQRKPFAAEADHCKASKRCREAGQKGPDSKRPRAQQAARAKQEEASAATDHQKLHALVKDLLRLSRRDLRARLQKMSDEALRDLLKSLDVTSTGVLLGCC